MVGDRVVSSAAVTHGGGGGCADDGERWEWRDLTVGPIIFFQRIVVWTATLMPRMIKSTPN